MRRDVNTREEMGWHGLATSWAVDKSNPRLLFKICEHVLAELSRRLSSGQIFSQNILSWEVCQGELRVCSRRSSFLLDLFSQSFLANRLQFGLRLISQKSAMLNSHHLLADSPQIGLRVIFLKSASLISQSHLADVPQFELRLMTASSFSHCLISQLADLLQKGLLLNFQILWECYRSILSHVLLHLLLRLDIWNLRDTDRSTIS